MTVLATPNVVINTNFIWEKCKSVGPNQKLYFNEIFK